MTLVVEHLVEAGLVDSHGVERRHDAHVEQLGLGRIAVAVAVHRHVVHHVDVEDVALTEVVVNSLCGSSHRLEEAILVLRVVPALHGVGGEAHRVDVCLAGGRGHADAGVLQHTAEATHLVTLEVGEVDHEVVVLQVVTHDVVLQVCRVGHGNLHLALLVHQVHTEDRVEAVLVDGLPVLLRVLARAAVGRAALYDGAVDRLHQLADECGLQVVRVAALARADFHGYAACGLQAQCLVDFH